MALITACLLVSSFLPVDQGPHPQQTGALGSRLAARPRALVATLVNPATALLHRLSARVRDAEADPVAWDQWQDAHTRYGLALRQIRQLEQQNLALKQQIAQLTQIRELFGLSGVKLVNARVTAASTDPLNPTLTINRGESHGVHERLAVTSGFNLVGEVVTTGSLTSDVRLVTAKDTRLRVQIAPPTAEAAARALEVQIERSPDGPWFEVRLGKQQRVEPGDLAHLTDPIWASQAEGFVVGQVTQVAPDPNDPLNFQRVIIDPIPSLMTLTDVTVLVPTD